MLPVSAIPSVMNVVSIIIVIIIDRFQISPFLLSSSLAACTLNEWLALISRFLIINRNGVLTTLSDSHLAGATPNCCRLSARSV